MNKLSISFSLRKITDILSYGIWNGKLKHRRLLHYLYYYCWFLILFCLNVREWSTPNKIDRLFESFLTLTPTLVGAFQFYVKLIIVGTDTKK
jgi:hypothetical protein